MRHDLARLASRVRQRRLELGLTQRDAALAAGVSDTTWLTVERGQQVSERTIAGVERAMRWAAGSAETVAGGGEPTVTGGSDRTVEERLAVLEEQLRALRDELGVDELAKWMDTPISDAEANRLAGMEDR